MFYDWFTECDFTGANLEQGNLNKATFLRCTFADASLREADLMKAHFERCDLRRAVASMARARWAKFIDSDFRMAHLDGMRIDHAFFERCAFHGALGKPTVEGTYFIEAADLSANFDGSVIDSAAIERAWGLPPLRTADE